MKAGVSTASFFMRKDNVDALPALSALKIKNAEVFLSSFSEYGRAHGKLLAERKGDVDVFSVHALNTQFEPQLFNRHDGVKKDAYGVLQGVMETAQALGATRYTFHGVTRAKQGARTGKNDDFPWLISCFQDLSDFCKGYGVNVCLETVEWASYNRPGFFKAIADSVPDLYGVLDVKQARISGFPYESYLLEMGEKISHVHVSDVDENGKMCLPGQGVFDFVTLIKRLNDVGFDGPLLIEVYQNDYAREDELRVSCEFLQELIDKYAK